MQESVFEINEPCEIVDGSTYLATICNFIINSKYNSVKFYLQLEDNPNCFLTHIIPIEVEEGTWFYNQAYFMGWTIEGDVTEVDLTFALGMNVMAQVRKVDGQFFCGEMWRVDDYLENTMAKESEVSFDEKE